MGVTSAVQHLSSGLGSFLGGLILGETATGRLTGYSTVGWFSAGIALLSLALCFNLSMPAQDSAAAAEVLEPIV